MRRQEFYEVIETVNSSQVVKTECGDFTLLNIGTSTAFLNGLAIITGAQYIARANEGEVNMTNYQLSFDNTGTNVVQIIRKIYK
jgi:hypothetical protein